MDQGFEEAPLRFGYQPPESLILLNPIQGRYSAPSPFLRLFCQQSASRIQ